MTSNSDSFKRDKLISSGSKARRREGYMHLGAFIYFTGHHHAGWRHPASGAERMFQLPYYQELAQTAERGKFDMLFLANLLYVQQAENAANGMLDPVVVLSSLAASTSRLGLAGTVSTTYNEPYNVARNMASLDHVSAGRAAWNIVTSQLDIEAHNYGRDHHPEHGLRYKMAEEFTEVVTRLWDSWEDGALLFDREAGRFTDFGKLHPVDFTGEWYAAHGTLNVPRPPQGRPVLIQAGSSGDGQAFAGKFAEVVFTAQQSLSEAQQFYRTLQERLGEYGRSEGSLKIMPGLSPIIGSTEEEARRKQQELHELIPPETAVAVISQFLNYDLSGHPPELPLPPIPFDPVKMSNGMKSRVQLFMDLAYNKKLPAMELGRMFLGARGHLQFVGTPEQLADLMEEWYDGFGCDGFNIMPPVLPGDLVDFVDHVVPVLQQRGRFRREYEGTTLRDHLGLERPVNTTGGNRELEVKIN